MNIIFFYLTVCLDLPDEVVTEGLSDDEDDIEDKETNEEPLAEIQHTGDFKWCSDCL